MKTRSFRKLCVMLAALLLVGCSQPEQDNTDITATENSVSENVGISETEISEATEISETSAEETEEIQNTEEETDKYTLSSPVFSAAGGVYAEEFELELSAESGDIYYTLDGSDPNISETRILYSEPIKITLSADRKNVIADVDPSLFSSNFCDYSSKNQEFTSKVDKPSDDAVDKITVVRASAITESERSETVSAEYFIGTAEEHIKGLSDSCSASGTSLAVISITMDYNDLFDSENGIYVKGDIWNKEFEKAKLSGEKIETESARRFDANYKQKGRDWEKECHISMFEMSPDSCSEVISQNCGIRIQGNYSRSDLQKGFRLFARKEYGNKRFEYDVFGDKTEVDSFKTLVLRAGGNCAFSAKFNDTYWQTISEQQGFDCSYQHSRPCVVYINGEYFGLYVLQEDYSETYFEDHYGVNADDVVIYKGDAEKYACGYSLDEGTLPEGETDEKYFFRELFNFFRTHSDLKEQADYDEFAKLVDTDSVRDYFLAEVWINNKWDWPGKNWSMWKTSTVSDDEYNDGRWRFMFYDMEFGGVSGKDDSRTNTVKEDNYKPKGLLDMDTNNPAVLCYAYLMTNEDFRNDYCTKLKELSNGAFSKNNLNSVLGEYIGIYSPLYEQFFERYPGTGSLEEAINGGYSSAICISSFIDNREDNIEKITEWIAKHSD